MAAAICVFSKEEALELNTLYQAYDAAQAAYYDRIEELISDWDTALGERSDKWKESDAGQEAQDRIDQLQQIVDERPDLTPDHESIV